MNDHKLSEIAVLMLVPGLAILTGCHSDLRVLQSYMTGSFSSAEQHLSDPDNYHDIRLQMAPIWKHRSDGPWLYVEQAAAQSLERPYRQRVYHLLAKPDKTLESVVYELPGDPLRYAGAWRKPERLDELLPSDLLLRDGCSITLRKMENSTFVGSTTGEGCNSSLHGASYATSEVVVEAGRLVSWDRGFDAEDRQVWGATEGGYVFIKTPPQENHEP